MKTLLPAAALTFCCLLLVGCNRSSPAVSDDTVATDAAQNSAKESAVEVAPSDSGAGKTGVAETTAAPQNEWTAGLANQQLVKAFESVSKAAAENPDSLQNQLQYINLLQAVGRERIQLGQTEKAYRTFAASGAAARKLVDSQPELPEQTNQLLSIVFYNDACAASVGNDVKAALTSLDEAMRRGFNDFDLLQSDEDLKLVRATAEFPERLKQWKQALAEIELQKAEMARQKVEQELAEFESFPFDFSLTDVHGKPLSLADHKGKVLIVDIWGTWCPPCRAEIPSFVKLQEQYADKGFQMIGLNRENKSGPEGDQLVATFMKENNMNYPCALIDDSVQDQVPDFQGYPTTLFLDRTGKVRLKLVGLHPHSQLEAIVQKLLDEKDAPANPAAEATSGTTSG